MLRNYHKNNALPVEVSVRGCDDNYSILLSGKMMEKQFLIFLASLAFVSISF